MAEYRSPIGFVAESLFLLRSDADFVAERAATAKRQAEHEDVAGALESLRDAEEHAGRLLMMYRAVLADLERHVVSVAPDPEADGGG